MRDFRSEIERKRQSDAIAHKERTQRARHEQESYEAMGRALTAFNRGAATVEAAPFLENEARLALRGMLLSFHRARYQPEDILRGLGRPILGIQRRIYEQGWPVARNIGSRSGGLSERSISVAINMLVTPSGTLMPERVGALDIEASSTINIPPRELFSSPEYHYRELFVAKVITDSVVALVAQSGVDWVEP